MPGYEQTSRNLHPRGANDNVRSVEPNTNVLDENPVPFRKDGDAGECWYESQRPNIIAVALIIVLTVAVVYLVR